MFNTKKINNISRKNKGNIKKSLIGNSKFVKEFLVKTVDKHKNELCELLASQISEIYNRNKIK